MSSMGGLLRRTCSGPMRPFWAVFHYDHSCTPRPGAVKTEGEGVKVA